MKRGRIITGRLKAESRSMWRRARKLCRQNGKSMLENIRTLQADNETS